MIGKTISTFDNVLPVEDTDDLRRLFAALRSASDLTVERETISALQDRLAGVKRLADLLATPLDTCQPTDLSDGRTPEQDELIKEVYGNTPVITSQAWREKHL